jgi:hypothetical protein
VTGGTLILEMADVIITGFALTAGEDPATVGINLSLNFASLQIRFDSANVDGSLSGSVQAGWDLKANKKV